MQIASLARSFSSARPSPNGTADDFASSDGPRPSTSGSAKRPSSQRQAAAVVVGSSKRMVPTSGLSSGFAAFGGTSADAALQTPGSLGRSSAAAPVSVMTGLSLLPAEGRASALLPRPHTQSGVRSRDREPQATSDVRTLPLPPSSGRAFRHTAAAGAAPSSFLGAATTASDDRETRNSGRELSGTSAASAAAAVHDIAIAAERETHRLELDDVWQRLQSAKRQLEKQQALFEQQRSSMARQRFVDLDLAETAARMELQRDAAFAHGSLASAFAAGCLKIACATRLANAPIRDSELLRALRRAELRISELERAADGSTVFLPPGGGGLDSRASASASHYSTLQPARSAVFAADRPVPLPSSLPRPSGAGSASCGGGGRSSGLRAVANCREILRVTAAASSAVSGGGGLLREGSDCRGGQTFLAGGSSSPFRPVLEEI
jgi:hypothetical protein